MLFASTVDFPLSLDFFDSGLYKRTAVARLTLALAKLSCLLMIMCDSLASGTKETEHRDLHDKLINLLCGGSKSLRGDHYPILVINAPEDYMVQDDHEWMNEKLSFLLDIEWKAIFDFDCNGHILKFFESGGKVVRKATSDDFESLFNLSDAGQVKGLADDMNEKQPSWIFVNGRGAEQAYSPVQWNNKRARGFKKTVQFFSSIFPDDRANVVFLLFSADIGVVLKGAAEFLTVFPNQWMCVVQDKGIGKIWNDKVLDMELIESDERNERTVAGMEWSHVKETFSELQPQKKKRVDGIYVPTSTGGKVMMPLKIVGHLPDIEILGIHKCVAEYEGLNDEQQKEKKKEEETKFYRGQPPTWWNFWFEGQVCEREQHKILKEKVEHALESSSDQNFIVTVHIDHQPGAGGTTLAKNILWKLRETYRVGVVQNCSNRLNLEQIQKLVSQIMDFHKYEEREGAKPVLLLLDNPDEETESLLLSELSERAKSMHKPGETDKVVCVFLECKRLTQISTPDSSNRRKFDRNCVLLEHVLSEREIRWFIDKAEALQEHFKAHRSHAKWDPKWDPQLLISFNILKSNFNSEVMSDTVGKLVKAVTKEKERTLLKYISLLNAFDIQYRAVPLAAFDEMMTEYRKVGKKMLPNRWENELSNDFLVLVYETLESRIGYTRALCSNNSLLAKETLKALQRTGDDSEAVSDTALTFFRCNLFDKFKSREILMNIVKDVLKKRDDFSNFSPLILDISDTESGDKARVVLEEGYKLTNDPFVAQQLARLLYIKLEKWDQASEVMQHAIRQLPDNSYLLDTCGRIYEKRLSFEHARYKDDLHAETLTLQRVPEVIGLGLKGIEMFQKGQIANEKEKTPNNASYYGELDIVCTLIECLICCDAFHNDTGEDLRKLLLHETFIPPDFHFLANERGRDGRDYIQILKDLKPRVDTVLKRLEDEKLQLKLNVKYRQPPPPDSLATLMERLHPYFGDDPDQPPPQLPLNDQCLFRRRQIFRLAGGDNMCSVFELRWKKKGEILTKVREIVMNNINSWAASADDYLIAISTNLALTSINPDWRGKIKFEDMLSWSKKLYENRQKLSKMNVIYLEPYLFMTMFNWPRENTPQSVVPREVESAISQWRDEFYKKYPRLYKEGKFYHQRETTLFLLSNGSGMESIYTPEHREAIGWAFWQQERTRMKLQRFEGELKHGGRCIKYRCNGATLNIPTSLPILDQTLWNETVYFVIGFSWAGPKAYDVLLEKPSSMH